MKHKKIILITLGIMIVSLTIIGVSYAFFTANIIGNNTAGGNSVISGTMELTFTDNNDAISLLTAQPGDSASKTFKVENTGTLDDMYTYNIKLTELTTNFKEKDLTYKLEEYTNDTYQTKKEGGLEVSGFISEKTVINKDAPGTGEMYLAVGIERPNKGEKQYYKITIKFENLEVPQDYNQEAEFSGKINVDDNAKAMLYDELQENLFYATMMNNPSEVLKDDFGNLRYVGATPKNYIWFNCDDYTKVTDENTAKTQNCEKWRIIGLFNNVEKVNADGSTTKENLVKIIRDESIGDYSWDNKDTSTGAEDDSGKNDWTTAELMYLLNPNYDNHQLKGATANNSLYWESGEGQCSIDKNNATTTCNFKSTGLKGDDNGPTKSLIESVEWNLGGVLNNAKTAAVFYTAERGKTTYQDKRPTTWNGKVGLIYPSDYGYAAGSACLTTTLNIYGTSCKDSDWLYYNANQWLLTPRPDFSNMVNNVNKDPGGVGHWYTSTVEQVRPTLYLTSKVGIKDIANLDDSNLYGSEKNPYILTIE